MRARQASGRSRWTSTTHHDHPTGRVRPAFTPPRACRVANTPLAPLRTGPGVVTAHQRVPQFVGIVRDARLLIQPVPQNAIGVNALPAVLVDDLEVIAD